MTAYSKLLRLCRQRGNLTQKAFVLELSLFSEHFIDLNPVTLSRWETGVTTPSIQKKKALLHYIYEHGNLDDEVCNAHIKDILMTMIVPLSEILEYQCDEVIGTLPSFKVDMNQYTFSSLEKCSDEKLSYVLDIELANHADHYYALELARLRGWAMHESSFFLGCELDGAHIGHIMMLKISSQLAKQVIQNKQSVFSIVTEDLLLLEKKGTYLVHTFFGMNSQIMAMLTVKAMLFIFEQRKSIENIAMHTTRKDGMKLTRLYENSIVSEGFDSKYNYKWYGMLTPVEEVLFSDTTAKMIF